MQFDFERSQIHIDPTWYQFVNPHVNPAFLRIYIYRFNHDAILNIGFSAAFFYFSIIDLPTLLRSEFARHETPRRISAICVARRLARTLARAMSGV